MLQQQLGVLRSWNYISSIIGGARGPPREGVCIFIEFALQQSSEMKRE
jgi:hypothetical protein